MNVYFSQDKLEGRGEPHPEVMWAAELLVQGRLSEKDVPFLHLGDDDMAWSRHAYMHEDSWVRQGFTPVPRWHFILKAGFVVATMEWMDSIARLLRCMGAERVLDIGAGHGHLIKPMTARGLTWDAVDLHPVNHTVPQGDGPAWLAERGYDVGYLGWPPMNDTDKRCAATGKPLIIVGEPPGACTGSEDLDDEAHPWVVAYAADIFPGFRDVPRWDGLHDLTMVVATQEQLDGYIANWRTE